MSHDLTTRLYEPHVLAARAIFHTDPSLQRLLDPHADAALLERFLIQFSAHGVRMTQPVEGWIRRAGERCIEVGLDELGRKLVVHARHEAGHDQMLLADAQRMVARWNSRRAPQIDFAALLAEPVYASTRQYAELHEATITGDLPAGQVAIELEIEGLSLAFGGPLLKNIERVCGPEIHAGQSFLTEHVEIDAGHTALNRKLLAKLLAKLPDEGRRLAEIGSQALRIYAQFLNDCLRDAERTLTVRAA